MPTFNYELAKSILNEHDKARILCIYLSSDQSAINWTKAANDFGSASIESFKKTTQNMLKKLEKAGNSSASPSVSLAKRSGRGKGKGKGGKKRKVREEFDSDDSEEVRVKDEGKEAKELDSSGGGVESESELV